MIRTVFVFAFLLLFSLPASAMRDGYSGVIEDLPLMPGMVEQQDEALVFDKPGGRIMETVAETRTPVPEIETFYAKTLPQLGWSFAQPLEFTREKETLKIEFEQKNGKTLVHFALTPLEEKK